MWIIEKIKKNLVIVRFSAVSFIFAISVSLYLHSKINNIKSNLSEKTQIYEKAFLLYTKIKKLNQSKPDFKDSLLIFVQALGEKEGLKEKILSVTPLTEEGLETISVKFKGLTLREMLNILKEIDNYGNLDISTLHLQKRSLLLNF